MGVRRDGELSEQSLTDALADENSRGSSPTFVAVGSGRLALVARRILSPHGGLTELTASLPAVEVDGDLGPDGWELREREVTS